MSDLNIKVTTDGVAALKKLRSDLDELLKELSGEVDKLLAAYEENRGGLGCHSEKIQQLLEDRGASADEAAAPVKKLQKKLTRAAAIRDGLISSNGYGRSR